MSNLALFGYICNPELVEPEIARLQAKFPNIFTSPKPEPQDTDSQTLNGCGGFILVNSISKDEE